MKKQAKKLLSVVITLLMTISMVSTFGMSVYGQGTEGSELENEVIQEQGPEVESEKTVVATEEGSNEQ